MLEAILEYEPRKTDLLGKVSDAVWYGIGSALLCGAIYIPLYLLSERLPPWLQMFLDPRMLLIGIIAIVVMVIMTVGWIRKKLKRAA